MAIPSKSPHQLDYSKFIYLHPSCKVNDGRPVYIDPYLLPRFIELVDIDSASGLQVARGLTDLKNTAVGVGTSDSNISNAFQHRSTIGNIVAFYTILQNGGRGSGVYITDLKMGYAASTSKPGLYKVVPSTDRNARWEVIEDSSDKMPSIVGVLGALPPNESGIASARESGNVFAEQPLRREGRSISGNGFSMFYTPGHAIDGMGVWLTAEEKTSSNSAADLPRKFAQILANTQKGQQNAVVKERFKWYVVGQGAKLFKSALYEYKRLSRVPLNQSHDFFFVDPQIPMSELQQDLRDNGIDFYHDKNILSDTMSVASKLNQLIDPQSTYCNLHRTWQLEKVVSTCTNKAAKIYDTRNSKQVCFSDLVKDISGALRGRWG